MNGMNPMLLNTGWEDWPPNDPKRGVLWEGNRISAYENYYGEIYIMDKNKTGIIKKFSKSQRSEAIAFAKQMDAKTK